MKNSVLSHAIDRSAAHRSDKSVVRDRILDAMEECLRRFGAASTTMVDVAETAGVSRATLYRYFEGREAVLLGVAERDIERYLGRIGQRLDTMPNAGDALVEFCIRVIQSARRDETLAALFGHSGGTARAGPPAGAFEMLFERTVEFVRPYLERWQSDGTVATSLEIHEAAEWVVRSAASLIMIAGSVRREGPALESHIRTYVLAPLIGSSHETNRH